MTAQQMILLAVQVSIVLTVFGFGLAAELDDVLYVVRRPLRFLRSFVAMFIVMPLVALGIDKAFELRLAVEVALMALALSPVPPLLKKKQGKAGGRESYALGLLVTMGLLSIVVVPLGLALLGPVFDRSFEMSSIAIATVIFKAVILPLSAGMAIRALAPRLAARFSGPASVIGTVLLVLVALLILSASWRAIVAQFGNGTLLALAVFIVVGLVAGHCLGGPDPHDRTVLALSTASRHPGIALALASHNFPDEHAVTAVVMLYLLVNIAISLPYVRWHRKRLGAEPTP